MCHGNFMPARATLSARSSVRAFLSSLAWPSFLSVLSVSPVIVAVSLGAVHALYASIGRAKAPSNSTSSYTRTVWNRHGLRGNVACTQNGTTLVDAAPGALQLTAAASGRMVLRSAGGIGQAELIVEMTDTGG